MTSHRKSAGRTTAVGVGVIGVVGVATLLAILFRGGSGTGTGTGSGTGAGTGAAPATQMLLSAQPQRPLKVVIRESTYVVNGTPVELTTLTDLAAKVPPGEGVAVVIERSPSSRAKAEQDLKDALTKKGISNASD
jgi:hypothetical protein